MAERICIVNRCAPGDVTVQTALLRDLHTVYPGRYEIHYSGHCLQLMWYNPHVKKVHSSPPGDIRQLKLDYSDYIGLSKNARGDHRFHFLCAYFKEFERRTNVAIDPQLPYGDLHLTPEERAKSPVSGRYWLILPGWKKDATVKRWSPLRWQQAVSMLKACGIQCVQAGSSSREHSNPVLDDVLSLVGKTDLRGFLQLVYHADGVICGVTAAMHMAAAMQKPCVVLAGGREPWWWEAYVNKGKIFGPTASGLVQMQHKYLHTIGKLTCCKETGCWQNKLERWEQDRGKRYCTKPGDDGLGSTVAECMLQIEPEHVLEAVMSHYEDGMLDPIGPKPKIVLPDGSDASMLKVEGVITTPPPIDQIVAKPTNKHKIVDDIAPAIQRVPIDAGSVFDDKIIGGKMTFFILMYGQYHDLHKQCLNSILSTVPPSRREVRIGCNEVCQETRTYLSRLKSQGQISLVYDHPTNQKKYPVMRQMFYDPEHPIMTKWLVWFDDDSICNRDPSWFEKLGKTIVGCYPEGYRMFGAQFWHGLTPKQRELIKGRRWYKGKQFQLKNGTPAPNGTGVQFATGGFWALEVDIMRKADIPDPLLGHNGGDYWIGEQVYQAGGKLKNWNSSKQFVFTSSVARRGLYELHPGDPGWVPGGTEDPYKSRK